MFYIDSDHTTNTMKINHLTREVGNRSLNWIAPTSPDIQDVLPEQKKRRKTLHARPIKRSTSYSHALIVHIAVHILEKIEEDEELKVIYSLIEGELCCILNSDKKER